ATPSSTPAKSTRTRSKEKTAPTPVAPDRPATTTARGRRSRTARVQLEPLNEPMVFIDFVAAHPVGSRVEGEVKRFSSHGAYVMIGDAHAYVALKSLGNPPPRSAREVLTLG